jgi:ER membrane protein SH3
MGRHAIRRRDILGGVRPFVTAGAGFLLAVLWFDLMFDVQVARPSSSLEGALDSIAAYYRRVTTSARAMSRLVGVVMLATLAAIVAQIARGDDPSWVGWASLPLAASAIGLALTRTFPAAARLGAHTGSEADRERLARSILRDHVFCLGAIGAVVVIQLAFGG